MPDKQQGAIVAPQIGKHLATINLWREADNSIHVTIAEAQGVRDEIGENAPLYLCTLSALRTAVELRPQPTEGASEALDGNGFVFFNPDTGTEWASDHPIDSGEVPDAECVRRSTGFEDAIVRQLQAALSEAEPGREEIEQFHRENEAYREGRRSAMASLRDDSDPNGLSARLQAMKPIIPSIYGPLIDHTCVALTTAPAAMIEEASNEQ